MAEDEAAPGAAKRVEIIEVGPRDGLQNEPEVVPTTTKLQLIQALVDAGVTQVQAASFVHPKWVPQMADAEAVSAGLPDAPAVRFSCLVPNLRGFQRALQSGYREVDFVLSASESFNLRNLNSTIAASLQGLAEVMEAVGEHGIAVRVDISTCFHCPFEGRIEAAAVLPIVERVVELGATRVGICDTDGMAFPDQVADLVGSLKGQGILSVERMILHVHDTYGRGLVNVFAGLTAGIRAFDSSVGGLGGCPFSPGASGNVATEDVVALLEGLGYETGIALDRLLDAAMLAQGLSARPYQGHLLRSTGRM
jgi:hydroxymethylglutaryl-CoA lyase